MTQHRHVVVQARHLGGQRLQSFVDPRRIPIGVDSVTLIRCPLSRRLSLPSARFDCSGPLAGGSRTRAHRGRHADGQGRWERLHAAMSRTQGRRRNQSCGWNAGCRHSRVRCRDGDSAGAAVASAVHEPKCTLLPLMLWRRADGVVAGALPGERSQSGSSMWMGVMAAWSVADRGDLGGECGIDSLSACRGISNASPSSASRRCAGPVGASSCSDEQDTRSSTESVVRVECRVAALSARSRNGDSAGAAVASPVHEPKCTLLPLMLWRRADGVVAGTLPGERSLSGSSMWMGVMAAWSVADRGDLGGECGIDSLSACRGISNVSPSRASRLEALAGTHPSSFMPLPKCSGATISVSHSQATFAVGGAGSGHRQLDCAWVACASCPSASMPPRSTVEKRHAVSGSSTASPNGASSPTRSEGSQGCCPSRRAAQRRRFRHRSAHL